MKAMKEEFGSFAKNFVAGNVLDAGYNNPAVSLARFVVLLSIVMLAPVFNVQAITGTLVNAALFLAAILIGARGAVAIGTIPSVISFSTGLLSPVILPMVPFIILSNAILILAFSMLRAQSYWKGMAAAAMLKFSFLYLASYFLAKFFLSEKTVSQLAAMMSWPQLFTALSGGILAYAIMKIGRGRV